MLTMVDLDSGRWPYTTSFRPVPLDFPKKVATFPTAGLYILTWTTRSMLGVSSPFLVRLDKFNCMLCYSIVEDFLHFSSILLVRDCEIAQC